MSCLVNLRAVREQLSANEKKIADFILNNAALIRDYSSQNLAASVGVSQSSIIKFSQKLNYRGFTDLKLAIHESVIMAEGADRSAVESHVDYHHSDSVSKRLYTVKHDALITTMELNSDDRLMPAVVAMEKSRRIQILAPGAGSLVAHNFASMLMRIGRSVIAETNTFTQVSSIATLGAGDTLFVISVTGQSAQTLKIAQQAKSSGATVISLTNYSANPIRSIADICLFSVGQEGRMIAPHLISCASQQHVVDVIFSLMLERDTRAWELLTLSRKTVDQI